jgi:hypothetical protein
MDADDEVSADPHAISIKIANTDAAARSIFFLAAKVIR